MVFLIFLPVAFALLHHAASPLHYRCPACGLLFARRTRAARFALGVIILIIAVIAFLILLMLLFALR